MGSGSGGDGDWDFNRKLIQLQDEGELARVRDAMMFQHPRLESFQWMHDQLKVSGVLFASREEKFWWYVEQVKKSGPLPNRGGPSSGTQGPGPSAAKVLSNAASGQPPPKIPSNAARKYVLNSQVSNARTDAERVKSNEHRPRGEQVSNARTDVERVRSDEHRSRVSPVSQSGGEDMRQELRELKKMVTALVQNQKDEEEVGKHKKKKCKDSDSSPIPSSGDDGLEHRKGKRKKKEKKKHKHKKHRSKKLNSDSDDESDAVVVRERRRKFYAPPEDGQKDRRPPLELVHRVPEGESARMVLYRIHTVVTSMYPGWHHWMREKKKVHRMLQLHEEVRKVFKNGDEIDTVWLEKKVCKRLKNQRYNNKAAVREHFNRQTGEYRQPRGMSDDLYRKIIGELVAEENTPIYTRAHQGDKGSRKLQRKCRTTNPWGQGGLAGFCTNYQEKYHKKLEKEEEDFAKEWTFKELVRKIEADAKGEEWRPLPSSKSKSMKDAEWAAEHPHVPDTSDDGEKMVAVHETASEKEKRIKEVRAVVGEKHWDLFRETYPLANAEQAETIVDSKLQVGLARVENHGDGDSLPEGDTTSQSSMGSSNAATS